MSADPALDYARPDVEALVYRAVQAEFGAKPNVTTWSYAANPRPAPAGWLTAVAVQVDVRGITKKDAYDRADRARRLLQALPWADLAEGVVTGVDVDEGPFWNPDPDNGRPRYTARYTVLVHPWPAHRQERTA